jgi:long-subunit acyl-CoA synthetase (AMP-forming)
MPKGAILTHKNILSNTVSINLAINKPAGFENGKERHLSYLPLAHMFERLAQLFVISFGSSVGFYQGDIRKLTEDFASLKPSLLCVVPRLLNKFYLLVIFFKFNSKHQKNYVFEFLFKIFKATTTIKSLPDQQQKMFEMAFVKKAELLAK